MSDCIAFTVPAIPVAQPRQRHRVIGKEGKSFVHNYTPTKAPVNAYKAAVQMAWRAASGGGAPLSGPLEIVATFVLPRPKSKVWKRRPMPRYQHTGKPDIDNLLKSTKDALSGLAWRDDAQVCRVSAEKIVAGGDEQPHAWIAINRA